MYSTSCSLSKLVDLSSLDIVGNIWDNVSTKLQRTITNAEFVCGHFSMTLMTMTDFPPKKTKKLLSKQKSS